MHLLHAKGARCLQPGIIHRADHQAAAHDPRETDSILFTGGEPLLRADVEELVHAAKRDIEFRSVLLVTNGTLLHKRQGLFETLDGLIVSLDALTADPRESEIEARSSEQGSRKSPACETKHAPPE